VTGQARPGPSTPLDRSRALQRRRSVVAKRSWNRRVHARDARIGRPDILWRAWHDVRVNGGAAGSDGVTIEAGERQGVAQCLEHSRQDLRVGHDRPQPVRCVHSPQPDGGQRP